MGQSYIAFVTDQNDQTKICNPINYLSDKDRTGNKYCIGTKLTEHSYIGNPFADDVSRLIYKNPCKVAWVGDYACGDTTEAERFSKKGLSAELVDKTFKEDFDEEKFAAVHGDLFDWKGTFIVNHSTHEYIDMDKYVSQFMDIDGNSDCLILSPMSPLSLLTAAGNGLGGGDYYNKFPCHSEVGKWCNDTLSIQENAPTIENGVIYNEYLPFFCEEPTIIENYNTRKEIENEITALAAEESTVITNYYKNVSVKVECEVDESTDEREYNFYLSLIPQKSRTAVSEKLLDVGGIYNVDKEDIYNVLLDIQSGNFKCYLGLNKPPEKLKYVVDERNNEIENMTNKHQKAER